MFALFFFYALGFVVEVFVENVMAKALGFLIASFFVFGLTGHANSASALLPENTERFVKVNVKKDPIELFTFVGRATDLNRINEKKQRELVDISMTNPRLVKVDTKAIKARMIEGGRIMVRLSDTVKREFEFLPTTPNNLGSLVQSVSPQNHADTVAIVINRDGAVGASFSFGLTYYSMNVNDEREEAIVWEIDESKKPPRHGSDWDKTSRPPPIADSIRPAMPAPAPRSSDGNDIIEGEVLTLDATDMPSRIRFTMSSGVGACPSGSWLNWARADTENNKAVYSAVLTAFVSGRRVRFSVKESDASCTGQVIQLLSR